MIAVCATSIVGRFCETPGEASDTDALQSQCLAHDGGCAFDVLGRVRGGEESGFELRRGEVNAAIETSVEKAREFFRVAALGGCQIGHWFAREEKAKHR